MDYNTFDKLFNTFNSNKFKNKDYKVNLNVDRVSNLSDVKTFHMGMKINIKYNF